MALGGTPHNLDSKLSRSSQALHGTGRRDGTVSSLFLLQKLLFFSCFRFHPQGLLIQHFPEGLNLKQIEVYYIFGSSR